MQEIIRLSTIEVIFEVLVNLLYIARSTRAITYDAVGDQSSLGSQVKAALDSGAVVMLLSVVTFFPHGRRPPTSSNSPVLFSGRVSRQCKFLTPDSPAGPIYLVPLPSFLCSPDTGLSRWPKPP